jgi:acetyltransferase-like isoleucine patch superfamily enzyme
MPANEIALKKPSSFVGKAFWVLRTRPAHVFGAGRGLVLFYWAALLRRVFPPQGVELGSNVRLQNNRAVMAEAPAARIVLREDSVIYENAKIEAYGNGRIDIGSQSVLGDIRIQSRLRITIGKRFLSSWNVFISDFDPHPTDPTLRGLQVKAIVRNFRPRFAPLSDEALSGDWPTNDWNFPGEEIVIGDDVWAGANSTVMKGARIGNGSIIAAGAVVLKGEYPAGSVLAGNPAKIVKMLS